MKKERFLEHLNIDEFSATPKYQQLVNSVLSAIRQGILTTGDLLPSINELSIEFDISRITVEKGYNELRKLGVLTSSPGKGYFVASTFLSQELKIFLVFNKLSPHKKIIYDAFVKTLGDKAAIDFYIYNNDYVLFSKLLGQQKSNYTHYVVIPHFIDEEEKAYKLLDQLPKDKLIIIDKKVKEIQGNYGAVYENFEKDIFNSLSQALDALSKYHTIKLVFPEHSYYPQEILKGFKTFCSNYAFNHHIVHDLAEEPVNEGEVFISLMEDDLVQLLEKIIVLNLTVGEHVGIISYNETPLKKFIMKGLTTISTDFEAMGVTAAKLVLNSSKEHIENPFYLNMRGSL
ncbi:MULTISPECIES: GntR family transcriptional regulator [Flectobacillus]|uniref:GntR family transcriptional regulator n=1 Tax=Flectobacillus roseus TaxID=502259 RepID=A0ABT6YD42_9BACT|nr:MULTISPECIES: GntR family transcriptional regulator [Flectobacillus]MDI9861465.1 GntR family transcriptional regulator [Flectobacillus roseus]PAC31425.1 transcriptional regulator [Flectobacillus sp. BAB-3569]